ncbi:MAG: GNAT family N-acetyltransferase [Candidatus Sulfotelmatobacter sp.]
MQLRVADFHDAEAITSVINAAFRRAESFLIDRDRIDPDEVRRLLQAGAFLVAEDVAAEDVAGDVAEDRGMVRGCVFVELRGDRSYLGLLSVDPQLQKSGLGSKLMTAAEDYCARAGSRFMDLRIVNVRKELPAFYHRRGYTDTGTEPFPPDLNPKVPCHFITMSKPLA